ncbi:MAG: oxidative damage protection protein [Myxococcales bacterium]|nr:oxidative damage protection protein [Myxococcales bacterium]
MPEADPNRVVDCVKLKQSLPALAKPPFPNALGQEIFERVSKEAWDLWLKESVRIINTYRVDLSSREGMEFMFKQLRIWLGLDEGELAQTAWTPPAEGED